MTDELFLYRGTTREWAGNDCLQEQRLTCTTTDPIVSTLFAIECRNHGPGVIPIAPIALSEELKGPAHLKAVEECAINLCITPSDFMDRAILRLSVDLSLEILAEMGHSWLPTRLDGRSALRCAIDESHIENLRLNLSQIRAFNRLAFERQK